MSHPHSDTMKAKVAVVSLIYFIAAVLLFVLLYSARASSQQESRLITVTGEAEVRVIPDEVVLTIGIETSDKNLLTAKNQNDQRAKEVLSLTKKFQFDPKHVQTDHISIEPRYKSDYEKKEFLGYFVKKTVVYTLKDISKFEDLLSDVLLLGANYVHGIDFRTTELRKHRDQARLLAIKAAKEKAMDMAGALGQKIGRAQSIREDNVGWWSWYNSRWGSRNANAMTQNVIQSDASPSSEYGSIAPGMIDVTTRVTVSFELE